MPPRAPRSSLTAKTDPGARPTGVRLLLAVALGSTACGAGAPVPDLILLAESIETLDSLVPRVQAIAIAGGRVVAVGGPELAERGLGPGTRVMRLPGAVVAPALFDHHVHLYNVGLALLNAAEDDRLYIDLSAARSLADVGRLVQRRAATLPAGAWVLGSGWSQGAWGSQELPTHEVLTAAAPTRPVFLTRIDGHAGWANRAAARRRGSLAGRERPAGRIGPARTERRRHRGSARAGQ